MIYYIQGGVYMWSREDIKNYAKDFLRKHYWKAFLVCLIVSLLGGDSSGNGGNQITGSNRYNRYGENQMISEMENKLALEITNPIITRVIRKLGRSPIFHMAIRTTIMIGLFLLILSITVGYALEVGRARFFLRGFKEDVNVGNLFSTFNSHEYFGIFKTQFLRNFYNLLWALLLIIPGIIKSYEYRMVPYILSEEPNLPSNEVITKSRNMTEGHKMDMFVLDLSFIGWYLLGSLLIGIGVFFVNPYKDATLARLYNILSGNDGIEDKIILE